MQISSFSVTALKRPFFHPMLIRAFLHVMQVSPSSQNPSQLDHFQPFRTFSPVVAPADDYVAVGGVVSVESEVFALVFELDALALPFAGIHLAAGFAVGEAALHRVHLKAQLGGQP